MAFKELSNISYKPAPIISLLLTIPTPITGFSVHIFARAVTLACEAPPYFDGYDHLSHQWPSPDHLM